MCCRRWISVLLLLLTQLAAAADGIFLIHPDKAGPAVDIHTYIHGEWVLWPERSAARRGADLYSLATGLDWAEGPIQGRGMEAARDRWLANVRPGTKPGSPLGSLVPANDKPNLVFGEVEGWDEVATQVRALGGRVLVVEYPPAEGESWSRYWLFGPGWPAGLPKGDTQIPGLVRARETVLLATQPSRFEWADNTTATWGGANRWFEHARTNGQLLFFLTAVTLGYVLACGVVLLLREQRGRLAAALIRSSMLLPSATLLGNQLDRTLGQSGWIAHFALVLIPGLIGLALLELFKDRWLPGTHALAPVAIMTLLAIAISDLRWTFFSPVFAENGDRSEAVALGMAACAALGGITMTLGGRRREILAQGLMVVLFAAVCLRNMPSGSWIAAGATLALFGEGRMKAVLACVGLAALVSLGVRGVVANPPDLLGNLSDLGKFNVGEFSHVLRSPAYLSVGLFAAGTLLIKDAYLVARLRRVLLGAPHRPALFRLCAVFFVAGLAEPRWLSAALLAAVAATFVLLHDAVLE